MREKVFVKSYSLENSPRESIFREDLFLYNCLQERNEAIAAQQELQAQRAAAAEAAANGRHGHPGGAGGIMPPPRDPDKRDKRNSRKEDAGLPDIPPSRPPLPHRQSSLL